MTKTAAITSPATKPARKRATKPARIKVGMEIGVTPGESGMGELDALLSGLGIPSDTPSAPAEEASLSAEHEEILGDLEIEAASSTPEVVEEVIEPNDVVEASADEAGEPVKEAPTVAPKKKGGKKKVTAESAPVEGAEGEAEPKPKKEVTPRKHYASKVERITDKLGASLGEYTVLTVKDAMLTGEELAARQSETLDIVKNAGVKVQNRMTMMLEYCAGKSNSLNEVITRAFKILHAEGFISVGEKGNFHQNLLSKPYSDRAARAMGGNTLAAMRDFAVIQKNSEGKYVANPESLILVKINSLLGLG